MARSDAQKAALVKKAVASESKSAGMRDLFDAGFTVREVADAFDAPYGFAYGVAVRNGSVTPSPREAREEVEKSAKKAGIKRTPEAKTARTTKAAQKVAAPVGGTGKAKSTGKSKGKAKA